MLTSTTRTQRRPRVGWLAALLLVCLSLAGCKMDPNETFIQGQWYDNNDHLANLSGESHQESFWYFDHKTFEMYGCCFAQIEISGYYRVVESEGDNLLLELYYLQGQNSGMVYDRSDTISLDIEIDRLTDTIQIGSSDWHTRVGAAP